MKDQIKKALTDKQFPDAIADRVVAILRDKCCMGADPTAGMLAHVTKDDMVAAGIAPAAAGVIETLLRAPKGPKKYKSGRSYSAAEYAEHYERDPENAALVADITRATTVDGKPRPWVIAPDKFRPEQSAQYIAWHMAEDHRGISAGRSVDKCSAWAWLLAGDSIAHKIEAAGYAQYGAPKLAVICQHFGLPIPQSEEVQRMIGGQPCAPGCDGGCGE